MYVDSGADITLVPSDFGKLLGMDLSKNRSSLGGISEAPIKVSMQSAGMRIGGTVQEAKVAVALRNDVPYLLGRNGIFKSFKITFEEYRQLISFRPVRKIDSKQDPLRRALDKPFDWKVDTHASRLDEEFA